MNPFKCNFNLADFADVLPEMPTDEREIINSEIDDIYQQYWTKQKFPVIFSPDFIYQEAKRLRLGVWILIKGVPVWIPPNYYQFLQYGNAGGNPPQFRLKRLKNIYTKIRVRKNPAYLGTWNIKNRQDGDTTMAMNDCLWEVLSGELTTGMIGIQSKTREDAINPCWFHMKSQWNGYPQFFKDAFYSSFSSGDNIEQQLAFSQKADPNNPNDLGKNVIIKYGPAVHNAFDGKSDMRRCVLDEINKWQVCSFPITFNNYKQFMMPGKLRKGIFDMISSPADTNGKHNDDAFAFWKQSKIYDPLTGATKTRIMLMYSNPLDGIDGFYDEFGDADPQEVYEHIIRERDNADRDLLMSQIRGFPLPIENTDKPNEEEIFGATDSVSRWTNAKGIKDRIVQIKSEPSRVVYGNLEWPMNVPDSGIPEFRPANLDRFDDRDARFCFAKTDFERVKLDDLKEPPPQHLIESCIGADPYNNVNHTRGKRTQSLGAAVDYRFRDFAKTGWEHVPTGIYLARPWHKALFHEDMIKFCLFSRAPLQYENSDGGDLADYFLERGYYSWLLDSRDKAKIETPKGFIPRKGDSPSGKGASAFISEITNMIDWLTSKPFNEGEKYRLLQFHFEQLLTDVDNFDKSETLYNHLTMALGQSLLGRNKILFGKVVEKSEINNMIMGALLSA